MSDPIVRAVDHSKGPGPTSRISGAGDAVALVAQPIARVIDAALGTNIKGCAGCRRRQAALNQMIPFSISKGPQ